MSQTSRLFLLAGAVGIHGLAGAARAEDAKAWSNTDEVRAIVAEMMADAQTRSSLLQSGATAGHDGQFFLASPDGAFRLNIGGQVQFRYYLNFRDNGDGNNDGSSEDEFESGFQTRRTKLNFSGHVFDPNLFFDIQGAFDRGGQSFTVDQNGAPGSISTFGGDFRLEDAFVGYKWDNGFQFRWGQFKLPFLREELVSSRHQLAADRSVFNETFNQDRSQGVELAYAQENWQAMLAFSDGFGSKNSEFSSVSDFSTFGATNVGGNNSGGEADWAFTGRAEVLFAGAWSQFKDFTSSAGSDFAAMFGIAGHIEQSANTNISVPGPSGFAPSDFSTTYYSWTADLSVEGDGWNAFIAGLGAYTQNDSLSTGPGEEDFDDYGFVVQAGLMIPNTDWEGFIRWDSVFADDDRIVPGADQDDQFNTLTFGTNYYMHGHASKLTADIQWFLNNAADDTLGGLAGSNGTGVGFLGDDDENEVTFRLQWQLLF